VDATVAAYHAFYAREGKPHPVTFPSDEQMEQERRTVRGIIEAEREAYEGPLKPRQSELVKKRDVDRMP
jgi:hypothetical protein